MPIFKCEKCSCIDNTAYHEFHHYHERRRSNKNILCTQCSGHKWHDSFPRLNAKAEGYWVAEDGFLYNPDNPPRHTKLIKPA